MAGKRVFRLLKNEYFILLLVILLSAYTTYRIHLDYRFPVHVDEWKSLAAIQSVGKSGMEYTEPYLQTDKITDDLEIGFFLTIALIQKTTRLSGITIFRFGPTILAALNVMLVFFLARRWNAGIETALMYSLIPTSLSLLGPAFLVPATLSSFFLLLALYIISSEKFGIKQALILTALITYLAYAYPPAVIVLGFVSMPLLIFLKRPTGLAPFIIAAVLSLPQYLPILSKGTIQALAFDAIPHISDVMREIGFIPTMLFAIGVFLAFRDDRKELMSLSIGYAILLVVIIIFRNFGHTFLIPPTRAIYYLMILTSLVGGYSLSTILRSRKNFVLALMIAGVQPIIFNLVKNTFTSKSNDLIMINKLLPLLMITSLSGLAIEHISKRRINKNIGIIAILFIVIIPLLYSHAERPYYRVIDETDYKNFMEIEKAYKGGVVAVDPWRALAFTPITGLPVYSRVPDGPNQFLGARNNELLNFFLGGCLNETFIETNNISIIYPDLPCSENSTNLQRAKEFYIVMDNRS